jgi:photosystem II stability/assembly factor-like uncharacterized protein
MKTTLFYVLLGFLLVGGIVFIFSLTGGSIKDSTVKQELLPITSITHGHGLTTDSKNPQNIYIATHHGLLILKNDKNLFQVGSTNDDYMGFSPDPSNSQIFYSSGHLESGGNIGFQKSVDGGFNWEKVSDGVNGPVDFHAMTVSPANAKLIYGWYQGAVQRSVDGGKTWEIVSRTRVPVVNFAADPKDEAVVYYTSPQGLWVSNDKGATWNSLLDGFVSTVAINPKDSRNLLAYSETRKLTKSTDGGKTWNTVNVDFSVDTPLFISFSRLNSKIVYLLTENNSIYKSTNSGNAWNKVL